VQYIRHNAAIFSKSECDLGHTSYVEHPIDTGDHQPTRHYLHRHPVAYLPLIDENVQQMQDSGIINPRVGSEWISSIGLVCKTDGRLRYCIVLIVEASAQPPRRQTTHCCRLTPAMICLEGTLCSPHLARAAATGKSRLRRKTSKIPVSFHDQERDFRLQNLAFGLCNVPSTFQYLANLAVAGLTWEICLAYLDDLIVFCWTFKQHLEQLQLLFDHLKQVNLKFKPSDRVLQSRMECCLGPISDQMVHCNSYK